MLRLSSESIPLSWITAYHLFIHIPHVRHLRAYKFVFESRCEFVLASWALVTVTDLQCEELLICYVQQTESISFSVSQATKLSLSVLRDPRYVYIYPCVIYIIEFVNWQATNRVMPPKWLWCIKRTLTKINIDFKSDHSGQ